MSSQSVTHHCLTHVLRLPLTIRLQSVCAAFHVLISLKSPSTDLYYMLLKLR